MSPNFASQHPNEHVVIASFLWGCDLPDQPSSSLQLNKRGTTPTSSCRPKQFVSELNSYRGTPFECRHGCAWFGVFSLEHLATRGPLVRASGGLGVHGTAPVDQYAHQPGALPLIAAGEAGAGHSQLGDG